MIDDEIKRKIEEIADSPSFFPNKERKKRVERVNDLVEWFEKYNEANEFYNVWGLDLVGAPNQNIYLDHGIFRKERYELNSKFFCSGEALSTNYTVIMRDKSIFEGFVGTVANPQEYVKSFAFIKNSRILSNGKVYNKDNWDSYLEGLINDNEGKKLVFKRATGCSGRGVYVCEVTNGLLVRKNRKLSAKDFIEEIEDRFSTWMIQPFVKQHPFLAELNPYTVNIIRIVTFNTGKRIFFVPSMLVYAREDTEVCNSDQGSFYVGISEEGIVEEHAIDRFNNKMIECPVAGKIIPEWNKIVGLALRLHEAIPELFTIGWDITVTEQGFPLVFEGNDGWCPYVNEWSPETALRKKWEEAVAERRAYYKNS